MDDAVTTLAGEGSGFFEDRRSRFFAHASPIESESDALAFFARVRARYPGARHVAFAYRLSETAGVRYSDDGEPQGAAGLPLLEALRARDLTRAAVAVARFFGGVLLGRGGLVRAYGAAAGASLEDAGRVTYRLSREICLTLPYALYGRVEALCAGVTHIVEESSFGEEVSLRLLLPERDALAFCAAVRELSAGRVNPLPGAAKYAPFPEADAEK